MQRPAKDVQTQVEEDVRAAIIGNVVYKVSLAVSDDVAQEHFASSTTITFDCATPGAATFVNLDAAEGGEIYLNGKLLDATAFDGLRIHLENLQTHNELRVVGAKCRYQSTGVGLHRAQDPVDGEVYLYTHFEPYDAHKVFACFDQPNIKGPFTLDIDGPEKWTFIANTPGTRQVGDGKGNGNSHTYFDATQPLPTYLVAIVAGNYHRVTTTHKDRELNLYCRQSMQQYLDSDKLFAITRDGLDFFEELFQIPYAFGKYDQIFVPEFNSGAMEHPGAVTFNEMYLNRERLTPRMQARVANVIWHEMAHQWRGNYVTPREWRDLFLSETSATILAVLAAATIQRSTEPWVAFANELLLTALIEDQLSTTHPVAGDVPDTEAARQAFDRLTYQKGAATFAQLIALVGERAYALANTEDMLANPFGNSTREQLWAAISRASGRDINDWAKQWLGTSGINKLTPEVRYSGKYISHFAISQAAGNSNRTLRLHRLRVGVYQRRWGRLVRVKSVDVDVDGPWNFVPAVVGMKADLIIINDGCQAYAKIRQDPRSLQVALNEISAVDNVEGRQALWSTFWDMMRDGELAASTFIRTAVANVRHTSDAAELGRILDNAQQAILYARVEERQGLRTQLSTACRVELSQDPGSDRQLVLWLAFVRNASTPSDLALVHDLWGGSRILKGITIEQPVRWGLLKQLVRANLAGQAQIAAELRRDPTDFGKRSAEELTATIPTSQDKASAWKRLINEDALSLQTRKAIMLGLRDTAHPELFAVFREQYFRELPRMWKERSPEVAAAFTRDMYPDFGGDMKTIALTRNFLHRSDLTNAARRILTEEMEKSMVQFHSQEMSRLGALHRGAARADFRNLTA